MPSRPPHYFEKVLSKAERLWSQLDSQPELSGPWRLLFGQVKDTRHLLSELFQNADDAGARKVSVHVSDRGLLVSHDGRDFSESDFATLCQFANSNKRSLSTIGFRGIGFKSTFAVGPRVRLRTPTLSVEFEEQRFTLPKWMPDDWTPKGISIEVPWRDQGARQAAAESLERWRESPTALLFFRSVEELDLGGFQVRRARTGDGPAPGAEEYLLEWSRSGKVEGSERVAVMRSGAIPLPAECVEEIKKLRHIEVDLAGATVTLDLVIGLPNPQRIFSVLPTDATWGFPFSCSGPFVLTPDRSRLTELAQSATNRWLLRQVGALSARTIASWVGEASRDRAHRARAYEFLPESNQQGHTLGQEAAAAARGAFMEVLQASKPRLLLRSDGTVGSKDDTRALPRDLLGVWEAPTLMAVLGSPKALPLAEEVRAAAVNRLAALGLIDRMDEAALGARLLEARELPKPGGWSQLARLWAFVGRLGPAVRGEWAWRYERERVLLSCALAPVRGKAKLVEFRGVVRSPSRPAALSEEQWNGLLASLEAIDVDWVEWVEQFSKPGATPDKEVAEDALASAELLEGAGLEKTTSVEKLLYRVGERLFAGGRCSLEHAVQASHHLARLDVKTPTSWRWVDAQGKVVEPGSILLSGLSHFESLLPKDRLGARTLHPSYAQKAPRQWAKWAEAEASGFSAFPPPPSLRIRLGNDLNRIEAWARKRGLEESLAMQLVTYPFEAEDWNYPEECWKRWRHLSDVSPADGRRLIEAVLSIQESQATRLSKATIIQEGYSKRHEIARVQAGWVNRLTEDPWVPDEFGRLALPHQLLRRTPETQALVGIDRFLHPDLDQPQNVWLWDLLGVGTQGQSTETVIDRLEALANGARPAMPAERLPDVRKLLEALDRLLSSADSNQLDSVRRRFAARSLVPGDDRVPRPIGELYRENPEELPVDTIHVDLRSVPMLWERLGVRERPSEEELLQSVARLPLGKRLSREEQERTRRILNRSPARAVADLGRWLSIDGSLRQWTEFTLATREPERAKGLFENHRRATADVSGVPEGVGAAPPFRALALLERDVREVAVSWADSDGHRDVSGLQRLGAHLTALCDATPALAPLHSLAGRLAAARLRLVEGLHVAPQLSAEQIGEALPAEAAWDDTDLLVGAAPQSLQDLAMARLLAREARALLHGQRESSDLPEVISQCAGRSAEYVSELFAAKFGQTEVPEPKSPGGAGGESGGSTGGGTGDSRGMPDVGDTADDSDESEPGVVRAPPLPGPNPPVPSVPLRDRLARFLGFRKQGDLLIKDHDRALYEVRGDPLPWEVRAHPGGDLLERLVVAEPASDGSVQLGYPAWYALRGSANHFLVLLQRQGGGKILSGRELKQLAESKAVEIYPLKIRLRFTEVRGEPADEFATEDF